MVLRLDKGIKESPPSVGGGQEGAAGHQEGTDTRQRAVAQTGTSGRQEWAAVATVAVRAG